MEGNVAISGTADNKKAKLTGKADKYIIGIYITLCIASIIESYSASSREITMAGNNIYAPILKHLLLLGVATLIMFVTQKINYTKLIIPSLGFTFLTFLAIIATFFIGSTINDAQRSIPIAFGFTLQPAELAKIAVVFVLSFFLAQNLRNKSITTKGLWICVIIISLFGGLLLMQGLTNTILFMSISFAMLIVGGTKGKKLTYVILGYILVAGTFYMCKTIYDEHKLEALEVQAEQDGKEIGSGHLRDSTWKKRIEDYFNELFGPEPYKNPTILENDQKLYSYLAQANGGLIGEGPGGSRETSRLPLAFSDYVYSIVVEETGFVGGVFLLAIYFSLLIRAGNIARRCNRAYPALLVMGMAMMIVMQALFHMAINTGVFPVSGQNLPLISKGGTSVLVIGLAFGVMLSVSRSAEQKGTKKVISNEADSLPESMRAANPTRE